MHTECVSFDQDDDGVTVTVHDRAVFPCPDHVRHGYAPPPLTAASGHS
jgi:hypothetical protein